MTISPLHTMAAASSTKNPIDILFIRKTHTCAYSIINVTVLVGIHKKIQLMTKKANIMGNCIT